MATAIPDAIRPRLGQFVRLLASDQPGEVVAAAAAIKRTLAGCGADMHALADAAERAAVAVVDRPEPMTPRRKKAQPGDLDLDYARRRDVIEALRRGLNGGRLSDWEAEFTTSILARLQAGNGRLTEKQGDALGRLLHRLREVSAWA